MFDAERLKRFVAEKGLDWPDLIHAIDLSAGETSSALWDHPRIACQSVGGAAEAAELGALALFCSTISIRLVDDILDEDPKGQQHRWGVGRTANLALAFQALGALLIEESDLHPDLKSRVQSLFLAACVGTSRGQDFDALGAKDEADYWRIVEAKTPPLFASAFEMGALLGGANDGLAKQMAAFGHALAMHVQITDDLADALEAPARDDWKRPLNNLAIHYAMTVPHAERQAFLDLIPRAHDPDALAEAQEMLGRSGAVSFCAWNMLERFRALARLFDAMKLKDEKPLRDLLHNTSMTLQSLLETGGASADEAKALMLN